MEGMNSKMAKPITIPISSVFERYNNHCSGCPECRVYPGHNRDLISSRDDIGGVCGDHEIHLGNWHHGKVATHGG